MTLGYQPLVHLSDRVIDFQRCAIVHRDGRAVTLSPTEVNLLRLLCNHPGQAYTKAELLEEVWGYRASMVTRTVAMTVRRVRAKIEVDPSLPKHLVTVYASGYRFETVASEPRVLPSRGRAVQVVGVAEAVALDALARLVERGRVLAGPDSLVVVTIVPRTIGFGEFS